MAWAAGTRLSEEQISYLPGTSHPHRNSLIRPLACLYIFAASERGGQNQPYLYLGGKNRAPGS